MKRKAKRGRESLPNAMQLLKPLNLPRLILSLYSVLPIPLGDADEDKIVRNITQLYYNITYERMLENKIITPTGSCL